MNSTTGNPEFPVAPPATAQPAPPRLVAREAGVLRWSRAGLGLALGAALAVAFTLWRFNPAQHGFYPRCLLYTSTGLQCPGCGALRASHQLLHGHFESAFLLNPLLVVSAPIAGAFTAYALLQRLRGRPIALESSVSFSLMVLSGALVGFGVARNLPLAAWLSW